MKDSFGSLGTLKVGGAQYRIARLEALEKRGFNLTRLPFSIRILLENLLRLEDGGDVTAQDVEALANWQPKPAEAREIRFTPARVLLQDFTGVPAVVDLAAMRDAMKEMGGDPKKINPLCPVELIIDHSVQVDEFGTPQAFQANVDKEFERNRERYGFLKWGQTAFDNFKAVPPDTGIIHQINLEFLARVVMTGGDGSPPMAYPDTLVGTDSHTVMINGLGVLGWGVGGIEAEAAMLGQPISMLIPQVVGFRLTGSLAEGATATDAVLTITQMLRAHGVVGKFVEYFGPGLRDLRLADRATIANMGPEYGATCGIFPVDRTTVDYLAFSGRRPEQVALVEAYMKEQGLFHTGSTPQAEYSDTLELDLGTVQPCVAGPKRPQDRILLGDLKQSFLDGLGAESTGGIKTTLDGKEITLDHGSIVIASITSCTNTSNPDVMVAAGLVAKKAVEKGLKTKPWVKTSLAPGSKVVTEYLQDAGLMPYLEELRFHLVGYGCATCIGNSGPLAEAVDQAIRDGGLWVTSILSGNRNFEGRIHALTRANYLASPPLVVAYALAGRVDFDPYNEPLGTGKDGEPVYLKDVWPTRREIDEAVGKHLRPEMFQKTYSDVFAGEEAWQNLEVPAGETYAWDDASTYVKLPPYFVGMAAEPAAVADIAGARALAVLGDTITTDHISPASAIPPEGPAGLYLQGLGVEPKDFNTFGSRRGNHDVMMRGTFANIRIRNALVPGVEGGYTAHLPEGEQMSIYDAAMKYQEEGVPLVVLAGKEYGTGSSRDWAAKGTSLLGVKAVIAASFERIHRSNLVGMGVLPLEFPPGESAEGLGLTGREVFAIEGLAEGIESGFRDGRTVTVRAKGDDGAEKTFQATVRLDTPNEIIYYRHGGILHYVLRQLAK